MGYSKKLNHGEAVLLGINTAIKFSNKNKYLNQKDYHSIINHFKNSKLPSNIKSFFNKKDAKKILSYMMKDKKNNSNQINLILLKKIGSPIISKKFKANILKQFLEKELI